MALILVIETATKNCSLALCENGITTESIDYNDGNFSHAEKLHVFIEEILSKSDKEFKDLSAIAVSKGPGSYTGLRIGVSTCKGLCYGLNIPLIAIETLEILARTYLEKNEIAEQDLLIPMIDARRMEVYTAVFDSKLNKIKETEALILQDNSFDEFINKSSCHFIGNGSEKSELLFKKENTKFTPIIYPSAKVMAQFVEQAFIAQKFEDTAYFEPYYLKDFVDGKKNKN